MALPRKMEAHVVAPPDTAVAGGVAKDPVTGPLAGLRGRLAVFEEQSLETLVDDDAVVAIALDPLAVQALEDSTGALVEGAGLGSGSLERDRLARGRWKVAREDKRPGRGRGAPQRGGRWKPS